MHIMLTDLEPDEVEECVKCCDLPAFVALSQFALDGRVARMDGEDTTDPNDDCDDGRHGVVCKCPTAHPTTGSRV